MRVRDTHRSFQEFATLVDSRYAYSLPYSAAPNLRLPFDTWERETKTLVDVRRLWEYAIDLDTGVRHEMQWFTPVWQQMWPGIARHQLAAIDERTNRESVNLVWVLIDEKSAELTKKCLAEAFNLWGGRHLHRGVVVQEGAYGGNGPGHRIAPNVRDRTH